MSESDKIDNGHCLCGAVKFTLTGEPVYNVICHCENCRRQGGSILHFACIFLKTQYTLHTDPSIITTYADYNTKSGKPLYRGFCSKCGSKVFAKTPLYENIISIPAGVTESAGRDWQPSKEQFCGSKAEWVPEFGEIIENKFVTGPAGEEIVDGRKAKAKA